MEGTKGTKSNKSKKRIIIILVTLILVAITIGTVYIYKIYFEGRDVFSNLNNVKENAITVEQKQLQTFVGNDRPIAVMIDNNIKALPHAGVKNAYAIYEIIVEGGESRLMALFKGQDLSKIGPIRSARHYFLDYALEHDAIYVHFGWSPQAESDIKTLGVNNINGIEQSNTDFWRVKDKYSPHNAVTSSANILKMANEKKYRTTSDKKSVFNYTINEVNLEEGQKADTIKIPYSPSNNVRWEYDAETKTYLRYTRDRKEVEWDTGEDAKFKNIIIEFIANSTLNDGENKDRQAMNTLGIKDGYYITNGRAIKIKCSKTSRSGRTVYEDLSGNEIKVNDGNTFVQIVPINAKIQITGVEETKSENQVD